MRPLVDVQILEDLGELDEEHRAIGALIRLVKGLWALACHPCLECDELVQVIRRVVGSLDQELTHEPDECEFDVCEAKGLVELFDDLEHVDEVEPVPRELL